MMKLVIILSELLVLIVLPMDSSTFAVLGIDSQDQHSGQYNSGYDDPLSDKSLQLPPYYEPSSISNSQNIRWLRSSTHLELKRLQSDDSKASKEGLQWKKLLRSGDTSGGRFRLPRQAIHFSYLSRYGCASRTLSKLYMTIEPFEADSTQQEVVYKGRFGFETPLSHHYELFKTSKYKEHLFQFISYRYNRTLCVNTSDGSLFTAPMRWYTNQESHECIFEIVKTDNRNWCKNEIISLPDVYLTTKGPIRALAIVQAPRKQFKVTTIPWSPDIGPADGCDAPIRRCFTWSEEKRPNCGLNGDGSCVMFATPGNGDQASTTPAPNLTTTHSPRDRACAESYCQMKSDYWRKKENRPHSEEEKRRCVNDKLNQMAQYGEIVRSSVCAHVDRRKAPMVRRASANSPPWYSSKFLMSVGYDESIGETNPGKRLESYRNNDRFSSLLYQTDNR